MNPYLSLQILVRYKYLRLINFLNGGLSFKKNNKSKGRNAVAGKNSKAIIGSFFWTIWFVFSSFFIFNLVFENLEKVFGAEGLPKAVGVIFTALFFGVLFFNLASKEITKPEWDMEWLITFPTSIPALIWGRIFERTIANPTGLMLIWPFLFVWLWSFNGFIASLVISVFLTLMTLILEASIRTYIDLKFRMLISGNALRSLQGVFAIGGVVLLIPVYSMITAERGKTYFEVILAIPDYLLNIVPWTWIIKSFYSNTQLGVFFFCGYFAFTTLTSFVLYLNIVRGLKFGLVDQGNRVRSRKSKSVHIESSDSYFLNPLWRREIKFLIRDINHLIQTLIVPLAVLALNLYSSGQTNLKAFEKVGHTTIALMAFGSASYFLMFTGLRVVLSEGKAIWLMYTFPRSVGDQLRSKTILWMSLAMLYPLGFLCLGLVAIGVPNLLDSFNFVLAFVGVGFYSIIAACFGIIATDPFAEDERKSIRLDYTYLYMLLASFYAYTIYSPNLFSKAVTLFLTIILVMSFIQKAQDYIPQLLEPTEVKKPEVSLSDGLIAVISFLLIQTFCSFLVYKFHDKITEGTVLISFALSGVLVFGVFQVFFFLRKTTNVPKLISRKELPRSIVSGVLLGVLTSLFGLFYLFLNEKYKWFDPDSYGLVNYNSVVFWILAVIAAPLCEEFIFRGLVFRGMNRTWKFPVAMILSALVFAVIHPMQSVIPVFFVGLATAYVYRFSNYNLLSPIIVHAIYNLFIVTYWTFFRI